MKRKEFERVTPESVGIPSAAVEKLLDTLEFGGFTEPHGLMIYRHGKVCAEGWWSPYAAGMRHALMSHTKTYAGTAVGIAVTEGLVKLEDRLIDIFPDQAPAEPSENLKKLKVQDVLCMGAGMPRMPRQELDWVKAFLANEIVYEPGTRFIYSTSCELLAAIVRQVSGLGLMDYLKPRLFDKLGIDAGNLYWARQGDGCEFCSSGLQATTEDNLRLMALYLQKGVWEGERILSEEFVKLATTARISTVNPDDKRPAPANGNPGYGFMMWMCPPEESYRADGMGGQYTLVLPRLDMMISITESSDVPVRALEAFYQLADEVRDDPLPEDAEASGKLARRMQRLCLPAEPVAPFARRREMVDGTEWHMASGSVSFGSTRFDFGFNKGLTDFSLRFRDDHLLFTFTEDGVTETVRANLDGSRHWNDLPSGAALCSAFWLDDDTLRLTWRPVTGMFTRKIDFAFRGTGCTITDAGGLNIRLPGTPAPEPIFAVRK